MEQQEEIMSVDPSFFHHFQLICTMALFCNVCHLFMTVYQVSQAVSMALTVVVQFKALVCNTSGAVMRPVTNMFDFLPQYYLDFVYGDWNRRQMRFPIHISPLCVILRILLYSTGPLGNPWAYTY